MSDSSSAKNFNSVIRTRKWIPNDTISPFLNVSGNLYGTAKGLAETIEKRKYDIDIYHYENKINAI
jgi:hypothetical protein